MSKINQSHKNIPDGWSSKKLGSLFEFKNGVNAEKNAYGSGISFINVMDIFNNFVLQEKDIKGRVTIPEKKLQENFIRRGDIFFNRTSEIPEEIAYCSVYLDDEPATFGGFVIRGRSKTNELLDTYKQYCFQSNDMRSRIIRMGQGAVRGNIGQKDLQKIELEFPKIFEQKRIVLVLEVWDKMIEKMEKKIALKKNIKKGLMQQLLTGKNRLSSFHGEWEEVRVGNILKERKEYDCQKNGFDLFSLTIQNGVCQKTDRYNREYLVVGDNKKYKKTHFKDIVYNPANLRFGAIAYNLNERPVLLSPIYKTLKVRNLKITDINFIAILLTSNWQINLISSKYSEGTLVERMEVKIDDFLIHKINVPSIEEQKAIADVLITAGKEIEMLEEKLKRIRDQKKFLLNNLVTGQIRVPVNIG